MRIRMVKTVKIHDMQGDYLFHIREGSLLDAEPAQHNEQCCNVRISGEQWTLHPGEFIVLNQTIGSYGD